MTPWGRAVGAALVALTAPEVADAETLADAIAAARTGPRLAVARASFLASTADIALVRADARPSITLRSRATQDLDSDRYGPRLRDETTLAMAWPLYAGGRSAAARGAALAAMRARRADVAAEELRLSLDVADVYTAVQAAREDAAIAAAETRGLTDDVTRIEAERRAGVVGLGDLALARSRLAAARRLLTDTERDVALNEDRFRETVGTMPGDRPDTIVPPSIVDADAAAAAALRTHPELQALAAAADAARHREAAARALARPTLTLVASGSYGNTGMGLVNSDAFAVTPDGALQQIGSPRLFPHRFTARGMLVLTVPLYRGGEVASRVAAARAQRRAIEARADERARAIVAQVRSATVAARGAVAEQRLAEEAVVAARDADKGVAIGRALGDRSNRERLDARRELADAQRQAVRARRAAAMQATLAALVRGDAAASSVHAAAPTPAMRGDQSFDLAALPGTRVVRRAVGPSRPLAYDLTGLG